MGAFAAWTLPGFAHLHLHIDSVDSVYVVTASVVHWLTIIQDMRNQLLQPL
jgi:hypothetical protein